MAGKYPRDDHQAQALFDEYCTAYQSALSAADTAANAHIAAAFVWQRYCDRCEAIGFDMTENRMRGDKVSNQRTDQTGMGN